jgi:DNA mismatch endonuclease, patch repair protein
MAVLSTRHGPNAKGCWWRYKLVAMLGGDLNNDLIFKAAGWKVLRFWEHADALEAAQAIRRTVRVRLATARRHSKG